MPLPILVGVGIGLSLLGGILNEQERRAAAEEEAARLRRNKELALQNARDALMRGRMEAGQIRTAGSRIASQQRVAIGASGIDGQVEIVAQTKMFAEMDALTAVANAHREALGHKQAAQELDYQADRVTAAARRQSAGAFLGMAAQTAGAVASGWQPGGDSAATRAWAQKHSQFYGAGSSRDPEADRLAVGRALSWTGA